MKKSIYKGSVFVIVFILFWSSNLLAQGGAVGSHDPGALLKEGNKYWMFTTGQGIYAAYSTDLFLWQSGTKTVFPVGTWPAWINTIVPGFAGIFWAPECFYMNGQYYMYYSCSTFGSPNSAIGVATSPTLDQESPDYQWTDQGMVVASYQSSDVNAIDPAIFMDDNGRVYMSYGSFSGGMGLVELDPVSGKRKAGAAIRVIAGGGGADWEAPYLFNEGGYYYLIVNRGRCCQGAESTYRMVMGRSQNIEGPYIDKNGVNLRNGGGSPLLGAVGRYLGPGHFGLYQENGIDFVSMHYYDGNDNGHAKLNIAKLEYDEDGWPSITRDWLGEGTFKVTNQNSGLVWNSKGCTGDAGEPLSQEEWGGQDCQTWDFTSEGNGVYTLKSTLSGKSISLAPGTISGSCNTEWGAKLQLEDPLNVECQQFELGRTVNGAYVFTSLANNLAIEVPSASGEAGVELGVWGHNGCACQYWYVDGLKVANIAPLDKSTFESTAKVTLEWEGSAPAYNIYVGTSADQLELQEAAVSGNTYTFPDLFSEGEYYWRVDAAVDDRLTAGDVWSFVILKPTALPADMAGNLGKPLLKAYPNPVQGSATIEFTLPQGGSYTVVLYDSSGKQLRTVQSGFLTANVKHQVNLSVEGYGKGLYHLQLLTNEKTVGVNLIVK